MLYTFFLVLIGFVVWAILWPVFCCARTAAITTTCYSNVKKCGLSLLLYTNDNDDHFPSAMVWVDRTERYRKESDELHCPLVATPYGYGMTRQLGRKSSEAVEQPADTVLLFESLNTGRNAYGDPRTNRDARRHSDFRSSVCFTDGHAFWLRADRARWRMVGGMPTLESHY